MPPSRADRFPCAVCRKSLKGLPSFQYHAKHIHSNTPKRPNPEFRCLVCRTKCRTLNELQGHCLRHHSPGNGQVLCEGCSQVVYKSGLADHIRAAHCHKEHAPLPERAANSKPLSSSPRPLQKPHTDPKVLVQQHVLGQHSAEGERSPDCELCQFEVKYKCSYKIIAKFCGWVGEGVRTPTPCGDEGPQVGPPLGVMKKAPAEIKKPWKAGPKSRVPKPTSPKLAGGLTSTEVTLKNKTPVEIKREKFDEQAEDNVAPAEGEREEPPLEPRAQRKGSKAGPKSRVPKPTSPKLAGVPASTKVTLTKKTPVEVKKEKFDEQANKNTAPAEGQKEDPPLEPRAQRKGRKLKNMVDQKLAKNPLKTGVPLSCPREKCEHFAWSEARLKQHLETAHGTPKVSLHKLILYLDE